MLVWMPWILRSGKLFPKGDMLKLVLSIWGRDVIIHIFTITTSVIKQFTNRITEGLSNG